MNLTIITIIHQNNWQGALFTTEDKLQVSLLNGLKCDHPTLA
jgi:hypothetical protein